MLKKTTILMMMLSFSLSVSSYTEQGVASYYHDMFHGRTTANGEKFDQGKMSAAHKSLPFNSIVKVTRQDNGRFIIVRVNDRGPYVKGRIIDLSKKAGKELGILGSGTTPVSIEVISGNVDESMTASALRMQSEVNAPAAPAVRVIKPAVFKSPIGEYEVSSSDVLSSITIQSINPSSIHFNYISINTATNCKMDINGEATKIDNSTAYYELEDGKKIKIQNYLFVFEATELTFGVSSDNQRIIISKRNSNQSKTDDCQFFTDAWLDRKKLN
jgi:rare lipoprotein A